MNLKGLFSNSSLPRLTDFTSGVKASVNHTISYTILECYFFDSLGIITICELRWFTFNFFLRVIFFIYDSGDGEKNSAVYGCIMLYSVDAEFAPQPHTN